ncbi:MAG: hypothetical protein JWO03_1638 [Bacteroidetes bacterium]|nr:hypothetical protein [Bacteroidota bacterium]
MLCIGGMCVGQTNGAMMTLTGSSYVEGDGNSQKTVNKTISITYDRGYCELMLDGSVIDFKIEGYSKTLNKGNVAESFMNGETKLLRRGEYDFTIKYNHPGTAEVTINKPLEPEGYFYVVNYARVYSENGKVTGYAHVDIPQKIHDLDSLDNYLQAKRHIDDSIYQFFYYYEFKQFNMRGKRKTEESELMSFVYKNIKVSKGVKGYIRFIIDPEGYIRTSDLEIIYGHPEIDEAILKLNNLLSQKPFKMAPIQASDGKAYSYYFFEDFNFDDPPKFK